MVSVNTAQQTITDKLNALSGFW